MRRASTKNSPRRLRKLERLLLDADVNALLEQYLAAIGFDVVFANRVDVNIHDDSSIMAWARKHRRIMVCHDRFEDSRTKIKVFEEMYRSGGRVIQLAGTPAHPPLTSLGKILLHRKEWSAFFQQNRHGIVVLYGASIKKMDRKYCHRQVQGSLKGFDPADAMRKTRRRKAQTTNSRQNAPAEQRRFSI